MSSRKSKKKQKYKSHTRTRSYRSTSAELDLNKVLSAKIVLIKGLWAFGVLHSPIDTLMDIDDLAFYSKHINIQLKGMEGTTIMSIMAQISRIIQSVTQNMQTRRERLMNDPSKTRKIVSMVEDKKLTVILKEALQKADVDLPLGKDLVTRARALVLENETLKQNLQDKTLEKIVLS